MGTTRDWAGRIGGQVLLGGEHVDWHRHDLDQLVYPERGVLSILTGSSALVVPSPGRGVYVPAGAAHAHRAHGYTVLHTLLLPTGTHRLARSAPRVIAVSPLLRELLAALAARPCPGGRRRERLLAVVGDELAGAARPALVLPEPADPRLRAASRALRADPVGMDARELAGAAGVSERTLSRLTRGRLGLSVPQWRAQHRLAASLELLTDGHSVTGTAHRCGWRNASSFVAAFRAVFGVTPGAYQRSLRRATPTHRFGDR